MGIHDTLGISALKLPSPTEPQKLSIMKNKLKNS